MQGKVSDYDKSSENIIWIKKDKGVNDYENNIFVACVYNSPKNLRYTMFYDSNVIDRLEQQLKKFSSSDLISIGGYFNSRAGNEPDYITEDTRNMSFLPGDYEPDKFTVSRNNEDVSINYFGQQLLKLCIAAKLRILNGRTRGDLQGHFTYFGFQGCKKVDLVLESESLLKSSLIQYLSVDHKVILLKISNNNLLETNKNPTNCI